MSATAVRLHVDASLRSLRESTSGSQVDWPQFWHQRGVVILGHDVDALPSAIAAAALEGVIRDVVVRETRERGWLVLQHCVASTDAEQTTLEAMGTVLNGLTRERVRQIKSASLAALKRRLVDGRYEGSSYRVDASVARRIRQMYGAIDTGVSVGVLEPTLFHQLGAQLGGDAAPAALVLRVLLALAGAERVTFSSKGLAAVWIRAGRLEQVRLRARVRRVHDVLTSDTSEALGDVDLLLQLNRGQPKASQFPAADLHRVVALCSSVERTPAGSFDGRFECLASQAHRAHRVLRHAAKPMTRQALAREVNYRMALCGARSVTLSMVSRALSNDHRFIAIGRKAWGLAEGPENAPDSIADLMAQHLTARNVPATVESLRAYVKERRGPVAMAPGSILTLLKTNARFAQVGHNRWGLRDWGVSDRAEYWNPRQVAEFVAAPVAAQQSAGDVEFSVVRRALAEAAGIGQRQAQALLLGNPAITVRHGRGSERFVVVAPRYEEALWQRPARRVWRRTTRRQQVDAIVRELLRGAPGRCAPLSEVKARLDAQVGGKAATLYGYIAKLPYVERFDGPGGSGRWCRLLQEPPELAYPLVAEIADPELRGKVERALSDINVEHVDKGLALLSKEYEAVLRVVVRVAANHGRLTVQPKQLAKPNPVGSRSRFVRERDRRRSPPGGAQQAAPRHDAQRRGA